MSSAWIGVIGALGGVLVTGLIGLITALLNHKWQKEGRTEERHDHLSEARAGVRRDAYAKFLVASDTLADYLLTQPVRKQDDGDLAERLRAIRLSGKKEFDEFDAAYTHVRLLCGDEVDSALTTFHDWFIKQVVVALQESDAMKSQALSGLEDTREPLIEAMKVEQERDLGIAA